METSTDGVLDRASDHWAFYQASLDTFGGDEVVVVALEGARPFDERLLAELGALSRAMSAISGVRRVDSLATVPFIEITSEGDLRLDPFVIAGRLDGRSLERALGTDRIARRSLISSDGRVFALNVILERSPSAAFEDIVAGVREVVRDEKAWVSGVPIFRTEINTKTGQEIKVFVIFTVAIVAALLAFWFRSLTAPLVGLSTGGAGTCLMTSAMGIAGEPLMLGTMILPSVMLALGCAYSMHVLTASRGARGAQLGHALREIARPLVISGLTTVVGFAAIGVMRIDAIRAIGTFGALGVAGVLAFALSGAVALVALLGAPAERTSGFPDLVARFSSGWVVSRRRFVIGGWVAVVCLAGVGIERLDIETDAVLWFRQSSQIRSDYESIRASLSGISPMNVVVEGRDGARVTSPEAIAGLDGLARHLEALPDVGRALSVADPLRQVNGGFVGNPVQPLPESGALAEQYLLLLEGVPQLSDLITEDRRAANLVLRVDNNGSKHLIGVAEEVERWWTQHGPDGFSAKTTGIMYEFARSQDAIAFGQIAGLGLAFLAIGLLLGGFFRWDWTLAAIALVPNVVPIVMVFGAMGWLGVALDAGTVVIGSLVLGIAVDDTVHLLARFEEARRGAPLRQSLATAVGKVAEPVVYTTVALAFGFGVLAFSEFTFTRNLGVLTAVVVLVCLVADLVLMPALLAWRSRQSFLKNSGSFAD